MSPSFDELAWAAIVDDLDPSAHSDRDGWVDEVAAAHAAELQLRERLRSAVGSPIRVRLAPCPEVEGALMRVGRDHLWLVDRHGYWLIATDALEGISCRDGALPRPASPPDEAIDNRVMASVIREIAGVGDPMSLLVGDGWVEGTVTIVGADFVELDDLLVPLRRVRACRVWY